MKPKTLKPWSYVKNCRYNLSNLTRCGLNSNPEDYYYQLDHSGQTYYPAFRVSDFECIPERLAWRKND